jgi:tRNA nucleotidyltransferase/poly(A) polymerase
MGIVRFIGNASDRIQEDYLRILRFFRFFALYGSDVLNSEAIENCQKYKDSLACLSVERITKEMLILLSYSRPIRALQLMCDTGILQVVFVHDISLNLIIMLSNLETNIEIFGSDMLRLFCLSYSAKCNETIDSNGEVFDYLILLTKLCLSNKQKLHLKTLRQSLAHELRILFDQYIENYRTDTAIFISAECSVESFCKTALYCFGGHSIVQEVLILWMCLNCDTNNELKVQALKTLLETCRKCETPIIPVTSQDIMTLGVQGKDIGENWRAVDSNWVVHFCKLSHDDCMAFLNNLRDRQV